MAPIVPRGTPESGATRPRTRLSSPLQSALMRLIVALVVVTGGLLVPGLMRDAPAPAAAADPPAAQVGWPDASNTGIAGCPALTPSSGQTVTTDGAVVQNLDSTGAITINANNVTLKCVRIRNSDIHPLRLDNATNTTVDHVEVDCQGSTNSGEAVIGSNYTATALNIHGCQDGLVMGENTTVQNTYCHDLLGPPEAPLAHTQCVQVMGYGGPTYITNNIKILHNTFTPRPQHATAAIMIKADFGPIDNVTVDNNNLDNGTYTVYSRAGNCCQAPTNIRFTNNHFGHNYEFGLASFDGTVTWTNNTWTDTGRTIPAP
jgi:hypothetical protein